MKMKQLHSNLILDIPSDVLEASGVVADYFAEQNVRQWMLNGIGPARALQDEVERLSHELTVLRLAIGKLHDAAFPHMAAFSPLPPDCAL